MKKGNISVILSFMIAIIMVLSISISFSSKKSSIHKDYDKMIEASTLTSQCFDAIKQYKIDHNIGISIYDKYECGMIGELWSEITTTDGVLEAKLTSCNPNFAALYINMFSQLGLRENDEIALMFSGSFPCLDTAALCAAQIYGLKTCVMASIGASSYGANNVNFTYIDMVYYLNSIGLINKNIDYASGGGHNDNGPDWWDEVKDDIIDRIVNVYHYEYINELDYAKNVKLRQKLILEKCPNLKCFINVGANTLSIGLDECALDKNSRYDVGIIKASTHSTSNALNPKIGLVESFLNIGVDCIHILQIKRLCIDYGITYNPAVAIEVGKGDCYYNTYYNLTFPIIGLSICILSLIVYYLVKKNIIFKEELHND